MPSGHGPWIAQSRTRVWLSCAVACLIVVAAFGLLVTQDRSPLDSFDRAGMRAEDWADGRAGLIKVLRVIEVDVRHHRHGHLDHADRPRSARPPAVPRRGVRRRRDGVHLPADHGHQALAGPRSARVAGLGGHPDQQVLPVRARLVIGGPRRRRAHPRVGAVVATRPPHRPDLPGARHLARGVPRPGAARPALPDRRGRRLVPGRGRRPRHVGAVRPVEPPPAQRHRRRGGRRVHRGRTQTQPQR